MPKLRKHYFDNSLQPPIYQTATYYFKNTREIVDYHEGNNTLGRYGRYDNPNCLEMEESLAVLDGCESALVFTSGMGAITATAMALLQAGDKVFYTGRGYRNIRNLFSEILSPFGVEAIPLPLFKDDSPYEFLDGCKDSRCKAVFIESPSNPHLFLADIARIRDIVGDDMMIIADSTFATPINYLPIAHGADLVIHSCGKYLGGHADLMAGSVAGRDSDIAKIRRIRNVIGGLLDPHSAALFNRSMATLSLRMSSLNEKGCAVAAALSETSGIRTVYHTSLPSHPNYALAQKTLTGHGAVVTFELGGALEFAAKVVDQTTVPYMGTNFGSHVSMIEQLRLFTYYKSSEQECTDLGISDTLIRLSIGFNDNAAALVSDIQRALCEARRGSLGMTAG